MTATLGPLKAVMKCYLDLSGAGMLQAPGKATHLSFHPQWILPGSKVVRWTLCTPQTPAAASVLSLPPGETGRKECDLSFSKPQHSQLWEMTLGKRQAQQSTSGSNIQTEEIKL